VEAGFSQHTVGGDDRLKNCSTIEQREKTINRGHPLYARITISKETDKQIHQREATAKRNGDYRLLFWLKPL
jgi:hypothetical protein